ncbi:MAG: protein TolR [Alphaproteobacteria bacterium]|nr:protein TolR [Alphaproteobacteria bacterium]
MAATLNGNGRGGTRGRYRPLSEINVTPMVDVMLVLLVIFMVTAPLMTSGVDVDLPKTDAKPLNQDAEPITVSINGKGEIYLGDSAVMLPELVTKLQAMAQNNPERRIFVRGDKAINYGLVVQVMGTITQGGFTKVALLAEQPDLSAAGAAQPAPAAPGTSPASTPAATPAHPGSPQPAVPRRSARG